MHTVTQSYGLSPIFPSLPFPSSFSLSLSLLLFRASSPLFFFPLLSSFSLSFSPLPLYDCLSFFSRVLQRKQVFTLMYSSTTYIFLHSRSCEAGDFIFRTATLPSFISILLILAPPFIQHSIPNEYRNLQRNNFDML